jgi:spermidine synthase
MAGADPGLTGPGVIPYTLIDSSSEHGTTLRLYRRGEEFSIRVDRQQGELMNSRLHNSEDVLAELACAHMREREVPRLLVGGLGMGFTLRAAISHSPPGARITVAELMPAVVRWNRQYLGAVAGFPLEDARVDVLEQDVSRVMREHQNGFDAIMLDVDNGPDAFTREDNDSLYGYEGLNTAYDALRPGGVLSVWSSDPDRAFTHRLLKVGFAVTEHPVHARSGGRGDRHHIWLGVRRP